MDHQSLNHLLSDSPWNYRQVLDEFAERTTELFSNKQEIALIIDEVGFRKKGKHSACVGQQYLGCIGKNDNGQVAVVCGLSSGKHYVPIDIQLFMPKQWENDHYRRNKVKIPDEICFQTKPQIALQMALKLKEKGIRFDYTCFDALYGSSIQFIKALDGADIRFIGDIKANVSISTRPIEFELPTRSTGKGGRNFVYKRPVEPQITVKKYVESLTPDDFELICFRNGTKQKIKGYFHRKPVWIITDKEQSLPVQLIVRKDVDGTMKFSFTNMLDETLQSLAAKQGQRVFIEKVFEEGKNQIGMGDYQVRSWQGFHKHMTLCFLALHYLAYQKIKHENNITLTSPIIRKLVASTIISKWNNTDQAIEICLKIIADYQKQILLNLKMDWVT